jgi:hypothetical protein
MSGIGYFRNLAVKKKLVDTKPKAASLSSGE